jgi:hypothetical protein
MKQGSDSVSCTTFSSKEKEVTDQMWRQTAEMDIRVTENSNSSVYDSSDLS